YSATVMSVSVARAAGCFMPADLAGRCGCSCAVRLHRDAATLPDDGNRRRADKRAPPCRTPEARAVGPGGRCRHARLMPAEVRARSPRALRSCASAVLRSEEHTSELQSRENLVCRLL